MKRLFLLSFFVILGVLLTACGTGSEQATESTPIPTVVADNLIVAEGRIEPAHYVDIAFNANGTVAEVLVSEGDQVTEGQVIARLENSESKQADVANAEEAFLQAEQAFNGAQSEALRKLADAHESARKAQYDMDNFDIPSDLRDMTTNEALGYTAAKLEEARIAFEPYKYQKEQLEAQMRRDGPSNPQVYRDAARIYKKQLDDAWARYNKAIKWATLESDLEKAQSDVAQAQQEYDRLTSGSDAGDLSVARICGCPRQPGSCPRCARRR